MQTHPESDRDNEYDARDYDAAPIHSLLFLSGKHR